MRRTRSNGNAMLANGRRALRSTRHDSAGNLKSRRSSHLDSDSCAKSSPRRKFARLSCDLDDKKEKDCIVRRSSYSSTGRHFTRSSKNNVIQQDTQKNDKDDQLQMKNMRPRRKRNSVSGTQDSLLNPANRSVDRISENGQFSKCNGSKHGDPSDAHINGFEDSLSFPVQSSKSNRRCTCGKVQPCLRHDRPSRLSLSKENNTKTKSINDRYTSTGIHDTRNYESPALNETKNCTHENSPAKVTHKDGEIPEHDNVDNETNGWKKPTHEKEGSDDDSEKMAIIEEIRNIEMEYCDISDNDCVTYNHTRRKMNLRSSGVQCNPDLYSLSLKLMKKPRSKHANGEIKQSDGMDSTACYLNNEENIMELSESNKELNLTPTKHQVEKEKSLIDTDSTKMAKLPNQSHNHLNSPSENNSISVSSSSDFSQKSCDAPSSTPSESIPPKTVNHIDATNSCEDNKLEKSNFKKDCEELQSEAESIGPDYSKSDIKTYSSPENCHNLPEQIVSSSPLRTESISETPTMLHMNECEIPTEHITKDTPSKVKVPNPKRKRGNFKGRQREGIPEKSVEKSPKITMILRDPSEPPPLFEEESLPKSDVYCFETDHVAMKHNKDYQDLLKVVAVLEAQRHQCISDLEVIKKEKTEALSQPVDFVERLQKSGDMNWVRPQSVKQLPEINWSKYASQYGTFSNVFGNDAGRKSKPVTRKLRLSFGRGGRGKHRQSGSSQSSRATWTVEEQLKLEELLLKYPSEPVEFNRFRKIATELGNRTPLQVQSRVQKYFIKLAKKGLPIPGNRPRTSRLTRESMGSGRAKRARSHPQQSYVKMSTFFPILHCPVNMDRDDETLDQPSTSADCKNELDADELASDDDDIPDELRKCKEYVEILQLKKLRREKLQMIDNKGSHALAQHIGFACDMCDSDPIQGVRYHCIDCPQDACVDLCQSCIHLHGQFSTENHKPFHRMEPVYESQKFLDDDYMKFSSHSGEYNYLDPNFHPAAV